MILATAHASVRCIVDKSMTDKRGARVWFSDLLASLKKCKHSFVKAVILRV